MALEYLSSLLALPTESWSLDLDLSSISTKEQAAELWNLCISLSSKAGSSQLLSLPLARLRLHACEVLSACLPAASLPSKWLCVSKYFLLAEAYDDSLACLNRLDPEHISDPVEKFSFFFWKTKTLFYSNQDFNATLKNAVFLGQNLPNEKFRLARFLYVEICKKLIQQKRFLETAEVLKLCQELAEGSSLGYMKEICEESKLVMAECFVELAKYERAEKVIGECKDCEEKVLILFKLRVATDNFEEIIKLMKYIIEKYEVNVAIRAVEMLTTRMMYNDACKCLQMITFKHRNDEVLLLWFKIIFALELANAADSSLEYLNISTVLRHIISIPVRTSEFRQLFWDYLIEIFENHRFQDCLRLIDEFFLVICNQIEAISAKLLKGKCLIELNRTNEAKDLAITLPDSSEKFWIILRCKLAASELDESFMLLMRRLERDEMIGLLQNIMNQHYEVGTGIMNEVEGILLELCRNDENKQNVLKWLSQNEKNLDRLNRYLVMALEECGREDMEFFMNQTWNTVCIIENEELKVKFMMLALDMAGKGELIEGKNGMIILQCVCETVLVKKMTEYYEKMFRIVSNLKEESNKELFRLVNFHFMIVLDKPINVNEINDFELLKDFANTAQIHSKYKFAKVCFEQCHRLVIDSEIIKGLLRLCLNIEEAEKYLQICTELFNEESSVKDINWIIGFCWNNAIGLDNMLQNPNSKKWMQYAWAISKKCASCLEEKVKRMYDRIIV